MREYNCKSGERRATLCCAVLPFYQVRKQGIEAVSRVEIVDFIMVGVSIVVIVIALGILL